jgi:hypothetical protein
MFWVRLHRKERPNMYKYATFLNYVSVFTYFITGIRLTSLFICLVTEESEIHIEF